MKLNAYLEQSGSGSAAMLAGRIGITPVQISLWRAEKRPVPVQHCAAIERATDGAVTRRDLRPNDWAQIWPELVAPELHGTAPQEVGHG